MLDTLMQFFFKDNVNTFFSGWPNLYISAKKEPLPTRISIINRRIYSSRNVVLRQTPWLFWISTITGYQVSRDIQPLKALSPMLTTSSPGIRLVENIYQYSAAKGSEPCIGKAMENSQVSTKLRSMHFLKQKHWTLLVRWLGLLVTSSPVSRINHQRVIT